MLSFLLFTHSGNQLILKTVKAFESRLSIELIEGSLLFSPRFKNMSWLDGETEIRVSALDYQFDWSCLVDKLCLKSVNIDDIQVKISEPQEAEQSQEVTNNKPLEINLPIELIIEAFNVSNVNFEMGEFAVTLKQLSLHANAQQKDISLATQIEGLLITLAPSNVATTTPKKTHSSSKKRRDFTIESLPAILTSEMLPTIKLPINLNVEPILLTNVTIKQNKQTLFSLNQLQTAFSFKDTQLTISQFSLDLPETTLNLTATLNFIDDYPLQLHIDGHVKKIKQLQPENLLTDLNYQFSSQGSLSSLTSELILSNKIDLQFNSHLDLFAENLPHTISLNWQNIGWPLTGEKQYSAKKGRFSSQGSLLNQHINFQTDYALANLPSGTVSLKTEGDLKHLQIESLKIETLGGELDFSGLLTWQEKINWLGQLKITDIDLQQFKSSYDGQFSGIIKQQLALTLYENSPPEWQFNFPTLAINGQLLKRPLTIAGKIYGDDKKGITFEALTINNAENRFVVNGLVAQQSDLNISLNIVDLSHAVLATTGKISGNINLTGSQDALKISTELTAEALSYQQYNLEKIVLSSELLLSDKPQLSLHLNADKLSIEKQLIDEIKLQVSNKSVTEKNVRHHIELTIKSELISTNLALFLTQTEKKLLIQLNQAHLYLPHQTLTLETPFEVISEQDKIQLTAHCWQASTDNTVTKKQVGKLCIKQFNVGESGEVIFDIDNYLLANVNPFLPEQFKMAGKISANADIKWQKDSKPDFVITLFSDDMLFKISDDTKSKTFINYPMTQFNVDIKGSKQQVAFNTNIFADNLIDVQLKGHLLPYQPQPSIDANVVINLPDFSLFQPLIPHIEVLKGALKSNLQITGKLKKPTVNGAIQITNGEISSARLPMKITELHSTIEIKETHATLLGTFSSRDSNTLAEKTADIPLLTNTLNIFDKSLKKVSDTITHRLIIKNTEEIISKNSQIAGRATLKGQFDWANKLQGKLHFYAHKLEIYDYGKIDLLLSPDIHILVNEQIKVNGELYIDKGKIIVKELPTGAISQSKDIVVIDIEKEEVAPNLPLVIDLSVDTGKNFQIVALGLDTFIEGKLRIKKRLNKDLTINGELNFVDGSYRSLGQQLILQKSRVVFQGAPESPYLKIEAIRDPSKVEDNVIAGVRVTGTPDALELVIFSEPAMAQQEALSYLTRGQSLNSSSDSSTMANMLIDIAAGQSGGLMSSIGEEVGIKDLSLSSSGTGDEQSVGVRGEIAPGVEISYGVGVFDNFSIFAIRYEMFEQFYIEASSGLNQAIDAYYEWDWD
ncbi:translocation/assembly module TamB domain-containing protein [Psychromonas hadalis]|uniref:translocation/assembly module TamB domain-containing protein n=1 Tax=Psychromonas hadalis TaxID=211669 RepID=UPI00146DD619|nr:translocation/assembly module TamB domain-containing protein [Psychromonas hadalis]